MPDQHCSHPCGGWQFNRQARQRHRYSGGRGRLFRHERGVAQVVSSKSACSPGGKATGKDSWAEGFERGDCGSITICLPEHATTCYPCAHVILGVEPCRVIPGDSRYYGWYGRLTTSTSVRTLSSVEQAIAADAASR